MAKGGRHIQLGCPHGCTDEAGERRAMTWQHAAFECQACEMVEGREAWIAKMEAADEAVSTAKRGKSFDDIHWRAKWQAVMRRAEAAARGGPGAVMEVGSAMEVQMRRVVGGLIERTGDKQVDNNATVRQAIMEATAAGLQLQYTACQAAAMQEEKEAKRLEAVRLLTTPVDGCAGTRGHIAGGYMYDTNPLVCSPCGS